MADQSNKTPVVNSEDIGHVDENEKDGRKENISENSNNDAVVSDEDVTSDGDEKNLLEKDKSVDITDDGETVTSDNDADDDKLLKSDEGISDSKVHLSPSEKGKVADEVEEQALLDITDSDVSPTHTASLDEVGHEASLKDDHLSNGGSVEVLSTQGETANDIKVGFLPLQNGPTSISSDDEDFTEISLDDEEAVVEAEKKSKMGKYKQSMKLLIPVRKKLDKTKSPFDQIGFLSFMTFTWVDRIVYLAYRNKISMEKMPEISKLDSALPNAIRLEKAWQDVLERDGPEKASFNSAVWKISRTRVFCSLLAQIFFPFAMLVSAGILIRYILEYLQQPESDLQYGLLLVLALGVSELCRILSLATYFAFAMRTGMRVRNAIMMVIYRKMIKLRGLKNKTVGELVNLCTNDAQRYFEMNMFVPLLMGSSILVVLVIIYTAILIGPSALVGTLSAFFIFWPIQAAGGKWSQSIRVRSIRVTDKRVRLMNEVLNCIKLIKMYAWEIPFTKRLKGIRNDERKLLEKAAYANSIGISLGPVVPNIAGALTISIHLALGNNLTAAEAFTLVSVLNTLRIAFGILPWSVKTFVEVKVAAVRVKSLLMMEELENFAKKPLNKNHAIAITNATFAWDKHMKEKGKEKKDSEKKTEEENDKIDELDGDIAMDTVKKSDKDAEEGIDEENGENKEQIVKVLFGINLSLPKGELLGVCGAVGSGKSSFMSGVLSQMRLVEGEVHVGGKLAYVAQQAWIFNATLKANVLFDRPYDEKKFADAVYASCLQQDIDMLPNGDQTEIGEKGINLSGGQKQRVSLARALYADCDVYLLDDPLSSVDAHVGQHIFETYIKEALQKKTVIFATHQLQYLNRCDNVLLLKDGCMAEYGTHSQLMLDDKEYANLIKTYHESEEEDKPESDSASIKKQLSRQFSSASTVSKSSIGSESESDIVKDDGKLMVAEEKESGAVKLSTYALFLRLAGGGFLAVIICILFILYVSCMSFNTWWLSYWLSQGSGNTTVVVDNQTVVSISLHDHPNFEAYSMVYGLSILAVLFFSFIRCLIFMKVCLIASSNLHDKVFDKVIRCPMSFFDTTPTGRIMNRFSKDMDEIDVWLPLTLDMALLHVVQMLAALVMIALVFPWFMVALVPLCLIFFVCVKFFRAGIRECKRLDNVSRSPWVSMLTSTAHGLSTIHAYRRSQNFIQSFSDKVDTNSVPFLFAIMCSRWVHSRLEFVTLLISVITALLAVISHGSLPPAMAGLALSYTVQIGGLLQMSVNMSAEAEARFTSVERMKYYLYNLESEAPLQIKDNEPPSEWPKEGSVHYQDLELRYRDGLPRVLKGISVKIDAREKIGIVGRTGSGKSSLGVALFRLVEAASGNIEIDGFNISQIGLHDLRSKLSIIPQDPVLFVGTIRYNLDPFDQYTDDELWQSLEKTYMKSTVSGLDHQLESPVIENGENFSVGERQLICMARALLRNSKILMLDEATAAIDTETDSLIQQTIRDAFKDCTMLTIAHRLNTVLSSDRILVMEDGKVVEFDKPSVLMANSKSKFSSMMAAAEQANTTKDEVTAL